MGSAYSLWCIYSEKELATQRKEIKYEEEIILVQILTWIEENVVDERIKDMLIRRLHGETLEDIGKVHNGISRERVRQLLAKVLRKMPELDEDNSDLLYWFKFYSFLTYEHLHNIFGVSVETYYYWWLKYSRNKKTTLADFLADPKLPKDLYATALDQFPDSHQYKEYHWHDIAMEFYKDVFTHNPYGRLTVIDVTRKMNTSSSNKRYTVYFICKCSCGNIVNVATNNIDKTKSCGCAIKDNCEKLHRYHERPVRAVETGVIYNSIKEATIAVGAAQGNILRACKHPNQTACGYHWEYVGERRGDAVRCIETGEVFPSITAASAKFGGVYNVLKGRAATAGGYHWEYVNPDKNGLTQLTEVT